MRSLFGNVAVLDDDYVIRISNCGQAQNVIAVALIFDEGDIRIGFSSGGGHRAMIPSPV